MINNLNKNSEHFEKKKFEWIKIQQEMKQKFGVEIFESWLKKIDFLEEFNNYILISVPTRFIRDWITSRYLDQILQIVRLHKKEINRIEFSIAEKKDVNIENNDYLKKNNTRKNIDFSKNVSFIKDSFLQYNRIDPNKNFDNFIISFKTKANCI